MQKLKIKVGIIDDSEIMRFVIRTFLQGSWKNEFEIVWEVSSLINIEDKMLSVPDILLLDVNMGGISGIDGIPLLRHLYPQSRIAMFTDDTDDRKIARAFKLGASDYISKKIDAEGLGDRLVKVYCRDRSLVFQKKFSYLF